MQMDVKVAQLLCSRLCHDLVGSASAINAGLELINEDPAALDGPLDLMGKSAAQITRRLAFFRVAFGLAEGAKGPARISELRELTSGILDGGKATLNWPDTENFDGSMTLSSVISKVCLNLLLAANECLPRGGNINVRFMAMPDATGLAIEAEGKDARISNDMEQALAPSTDMAQVNAHNVHVFYAQSLSRGAGCAIECQMDPSHNTVQIAVVFPTG